MSIASRTNSHTSAAYMSGEEIAWHINRVPPEPFGEYMRKQGAAPEDGWIMVLPQSMCRPGALLPAYVRTSPILKEPVIMAPRRCGIDVPVQTHVPEETPHGRTE